MNDNEAQGEQSARAGSAVMPRGAPDAPLRDGDYDARARQGPEYQAQLWLAIYGCRGAAAAQAHRRAGDRARGPTPRAHRLPPDRRWPHGAYRLAERAYQYAGQRIHVVRGGALAHPSAAARGCSRAPRAAVQPPGDGDLPGALPPAARRAARGGAPAPDRGRVRAGDA